MNEHLLRPENQVGYTDSEHQASAALLNNYRYTGSGTPGSSLYESEAERSVMGLDRAPVDPNKIFQDTLKNYQSTLDALNVSFDNRIRQSEPDRENRLGQSRAIQASYGVQGSPMGSAQEEKVRKFNQQELQNINDERNLMIQDVYGKIRSEAKDEIRAKKEEILGNTKSYLEFLKGQKESKEADIVQLGSKGIRTTDLKSKDPQGFAKLLSILGMSEDDLDFKLNDYRKQAEKIVWEKPVTLKDGRLMMVGHDPLNPDKPVTKTIDADVPEGSESVFASVNGVSGVYYKDAQGNLIPATTTQEAGMDKAKLDSDLELNKAKIEGERASTAKTYADIKKLNADTEKVLNDVAKNAPGAPNELKTTALTAAQDLLKRFEGGQTFAVGGSSLFGTLPGTQSRDFVKNLENVKSLLSLENIKYLKGQGAVSDAERDLLSKASTQLSRDQSEEQFAETLKGIVKTLGGESTTGSNTADEEYLKLLGL